MKRSFLCKLLLGSILTLSPSLFCLSSCAEQAISYTPEYISINYYDSTTIACKPNESHTIDWNISSCVYPLGADQQVSWSIVDDITPNKVVKINDDNKITWTGISNVGQYTFNLKAISKSKPSIENIEKFTIVVSNEITPEYVSINYNGNNTIYCDKDEDYTIDWTLSGSVYPSTFTQNITWSIAEDQTKKVQIQNGKISWSAIGSYGKYTFKLVAKATNYESVSTYLMFTINTIDDGKLSSETYYDYIAQRTLSVGAIGISSTGHLDAASSGTMWFYKRLSDYTYEFITNYHVWDGIKGIMDAYAESSRLLCVIGNPDSSNPYTSGYENYIPTMPSYTQEDLSPITVNVGTYTDGSETKDLYMDMCAITVNLQNAYNSSSSIAGASKGVSNFKEQIDYINNEYGVGEKIVSINTDKPSIGDEVYIAGYPWANSEESSSDSRSFTYLAQVKTKLYQSNGPQLNQISGSSYYTYQDECFMEGKETFALGGGASGSMMLNEDMQVSGIYWGGISNLSPSYKFYPSIAFFNLDNSAYGTHHFFDIVDQNI